MFEKSLSVKEQLNPLNQHISGKRFLTDEGMLRAVEWGLISGVDVMGQKRQQPATLDMLIESIVPVGMDLFPMRKTSEDITFESKRWYEAYFTESVDYTSYKPLELGAPHFFSLSADLRSSNIQLGLALALGGCVLRPGDNHAREAVYVFNDSPNDLHYDVNERFAQFYFFVDPYADTYFKSFDLDGPLPTDESGEPIRALPMGVKLETNEAVNYLRKTGDLVLESQGEFPMEDGELIFHASDEAYRIKSVDGGIPFSKRKDLTGWERFNIKDGYKVKPGEHVRIMTQENIRFCSDKVGIRLRDMPMSPSDYYHLDPQMFDFNSRMVNASAGWFDPGFLMGEGGNSIGRYPKIAGQIIRPGDPVSIGRVFYAPGGVGTSYGSAELGSQYQNVVRH